MPTPADNEQLSEALRHAASYAAELAGGGLALIFASVAGESGAVAATRLRAAAGFASAEEARQLAGSILNAAQEVVKTGSAATTGPVAGAGPRGSGGLLLLPIQGERDCLGALVVGFPSPLDPSRQASLKSLAQCTGVHLAYPALKQRIAELENSRSSAHEPAEGSDELLRMSEELFAQDLQLLQSEEKLGTIEKLKNDFIEKMSRELRTPLNSIIEATIAVLAGENEVLSETSKEMLRRALDEGTAFQRTLQIILDLWRLKQNELPVEIQDLSFSEVIDEAIFSVQDTLGDKPVTIEKQLDEPFPKIRTDLAKVNQILFLLLDNAAKFTPEGEIKITAQVHDGLLRCQIADTGIGVCPDDQQFIFDEFFMVDDLSSGTYRGAGLGLTLVRDLLVLLEGACTVNSEPGRGTRIEFQIPVQIA